MATTRNNRTGNEIQKAITGPMERRSSLDEEPTKHKNFFRRHAFEVFVLACAAVTIFIVSVFDLAAGELGKFTFPGQLAVIIWIYLLVVLAWPIVKAVMLRKVQPYFWVRIGVAVLFLVVTLPVFQLLLAFYVEAIKGEDPTAVKWAVTPLGAVFGPLGILLIGLGAVLLARYREPDEHHLADIEDVPHLEDQVKQLKEQAASARGVETQHRAKHELLQGQTQGVNDTAQRAGDDLTEAQKAHDESSVFAEFSKAEKKQVTSVADLRKTEDSLEMKRDELLNLDESDEKYSAKFDTIQKQIKSLEDKLDPARKAVERDEVQLQSCKTALDGSPVKARLDSAVAAHKAATKAQSSHDEELEIEKKKHLAAASDAAAISKTCEDRELELKQLKQRIDENGGKDWRDLLVIPAVAAALIILGLILTSVYPGFQVVNAIKGAI